MKTMRMSRTAENRNARKDMAARGRASMSKGALLAPDVVLSGRRFHRANKLSHAEAAALEALVRGPDGTAPRPMLSVDADQLERMMTGWHVN